jgi:peptide chain release factor 2
LWNDSAAAQKLMRERNQLASQMDGVRKLALDVSDTLELIELAEAEGDATMVADGMTALRALAEEAKRREIESLLAGEADANDAYIEINAGTGGTEAQDWAEMLMRMYMRWSSTTIRCSCWNRARASRLASSRRRYRSVDRTRTAG